MKQPLPTWLLCVWKNPDFPDRVAHLRTIYQIDMVDAQGENHGSTNQTDLRKQGFFIPDFSHLPQGQYRFSEIMNNPTLLAS